MTQYKMRKFVPLDQFLSKYNERNTSGKFRPVAVGRYGIRKRESIYSKELAKDYSKNKLIYKDTLTVGMGSVQIDIGILSEDIVYSVSPAYHTFKISGISSDYLRYCLQARNQDMFVRYVKRGSRQGKTIDLNRWIEYEIPVYELDMQKVIVQKLDKVTRIVELKKKQIEELNNLIKSRFIEMFGDLAINPYFWEEKLLSELCKEKDDIKCGPFGTQLSKDEYQKEGIPLWGIPQINSMFNIQPTDYLTKEKAEQLAAYTIIPGDIVMSRKGNVGRCAIYPRNYPLGIMHSDALRIRSDEFIINSDFLVHQLHYSRYVVNQINLVSNGAIMAGVNVTKLKSIYIHVPPIELQNQFAVFVQQVDKQKVIVQKSLQETQTLFDSLMQKYFG